MLEILFIIFLARKIGELAEAKARNPTGWKVFVVFAWLAGEVVGLIIGTIAAMIANGTEEDPSLLIVYPFALVGAGIGAGTVFLIMKLLAPAQPNG